MLTSDKSSSTLKGQRSQQSESGKVSVYVPPGSARSRMYRQGAGRSLSSKVPEPLLLSQSFMKGVQ